MRIAFDVPLVKAVFGLERQRGKKIVIIKRSHASRKACNNLILFLEPGEEPGALAENCRHKSSPKAVVFRHNISKLILWICCAECLLPSSDGNKPRLFLFGLLDLAQRKQPFFNGPFSKSRQGENMEKGFTLIELLVVVLIIGILAAVALPQYEKTVEKSRATEALTTTKNIVDAVEMSILSTGGFVGPENKNPDNWDISLTGGYWKDSGCCGAMYVTRNFFYLPNDDATGVGAYRCKGTCSGNTNDNTLYELWRCYPSIDGENCLLCFSNSQEGTKICKSLASLGVEYRP